MKMRKRIAALIAAAMIAALMPMTAFAASTNQLTKGIVKVGKDTVIAEAVAPGLEIVLKHDFTSDSAFYLELENAEWEENDEVTDGWAGKAGAGVVLTRVDGKTLEVKSKGMVATDVITVPLIVKVTGGDASVTIDSYGSVVTGGKYTFAVSDDSKAKVTVGDVPVIVANGKMATITIEEPYQGAFASKIENGKVEIDIELDDTDFDFTNKGSVVVKRGFEAGITTNILSNGKLRVTFPSAAISGKQLGIIELKDVVVSASRKAAEGDVSAYINGDIVDSQTLVVAKYGDYSTKLTTKEVAEFTSGRKETLKFKLEQIGAGAVIQTRSLDFELSKDIKITSVTAKGQTSFTVDSDQIDKNEFTMLDLTALGNKSEIEFEVKVDIPAKFEGDILVNAIGRAIEETKELKLAEVTAPVTVVVEAMKVPIGQKSNKGGRITITETDKKMLKRDTLVIKLPKDLVEDGVEFLNVKDLVVETTGGIKVDEATLDTTSSAIEIKITRQSNEAGSIDISGFEVKSRRNLADGAYEIEVGGPAISELSDFDAIETADFLLVGDQLTNAEVKFVIGSDKFVVDGKEMTMDAAAYIKDGRTMVPLRYLSYAVGIDEQSIKFDAGIVTIIDGMRIIQLQSGSKNLLVNGMTIPMSAAAEIVDGRTYVPVAEIGAVYGVRGTWDAATQTATFK